MIAPRRVWPWYAAVLGLLILDQGSKALVRHILVLHESIPLIGRDFLRLTYVRNPGIGFGVQFLNIGTLLVFGWAASVILAFYLFRLVRRHDPLRWPVMLFLAGALGNSIDRLLFGQVTDFVDMDFPDVIMARWPVFNVADSCVTIGIVSVAVLILFGRRARPPSAVGDHATPSSPTENLPPEDRSGSATAAD
jgi:signal peptidase II